MDHDEDLQRRLRAQRPSLPQARLDAIGRELTPPRRPGRSYRTALTTALVGLGLLTSGGGTALAISGLASDTTAVVAQYGGSTAGTTDTTGTAGTTTTTDTTGVSAAGSTACRRSLRQAAPTLGGCPSAPTSGVDPATANSTTPSATDDPAGSTDPAGSNGVKDTTASGSGTTPTAVSADQASGQVAALGSSGSLPFTGWSAIPILLAGIALLAGGLSLRWADSRGRRA